MIDIIKQILSSDMWYGFGVIAIVIALLFLIVYLSDEKRIKPN